MKRFMLLLMFVCISALNGVAQNYQDVVYLKNGSIVKGVVVEQVPNQSIKIQTSDGSIFAFDMSEVIKMTKEENIRRGSSSFSGNNYKIMSKYRGFIDFGYTIGTGTFKVGRIELTTSHGYQFNPMFFVGIGAGVSYWFDSETVAIPIFANFRVDIPTGAIVNPYFDVKFGFSPYDIQGIYGNFSLGCRIATSMSNAFNISVGYQLQRGKVEDEYARYYLGNNISANGIALKLGFEF